MGFKLKSGNKINFKQMVSSPLKKEPGVKLHKIHHLPEVKIVGKKTPVIGKQYPTVTVTEKKKVKKVAKKKYEPEKVIPKTKEKSNLKTQLEKLYKKRDYQKKLKKRRKDYMRKTRKIINLLDKPGLSGGPSINKL